MSEPHATPPYAPDDFYRAYAIAMLNWQKVEAALFRLLYSLYTGGNLEQAGAAYYSLDSFGAKLRLIDATARATLVGQPLETWTALNEQIKEASGDRNALAHLPAMVTPNDDGSLSLVLGPHIYVPKALLRKRAKVYDAAECERFAFAFERLEQLIDAFTAAPR